MKRRLYHHGAWILTAFLLAAGCTQTRFFAEWMDEKYQGHRLESVLVVGISDQLSNRKMFEREFVEAFDDRDVKAAASVDVIPVGQKLTKDEIKQKAIEKGYKAVMVTHLLSVDQEEMYHPEIGGWIPGQYYYSFGTYYRHVDTYVHYPGYYTTHTFVRLESNLYDTATERLIWSVSSETIDPDTVKEVIDSLSDAVMDNLRKHGLIGMKKRQ